MYRRNLTCMCFRKEILSSSRTERFQLIYFPFTITMMHLYNGNAHIELCSVQTDQQTQFMPWKSHGSMQMRVMLKPSCFRVLANNWQGSGRNIIPSPPPTYSRLFVWISVPWSIHAGHSWKKDIEKGGLGIRGGTKYFVSQVLGELVLAHKLKV